MSKKPLKSFPPLLTDEEAERFTDEADLSEYDFSGFRPVRFEFQKKEGRLNMRLPHDQLQALNAAAEREGIPYTRLARQSIEEGIQAHRQR
jgi:predicted DNA binding CopG/RHH family protein